MATATVERFTMNIEYAINALTRERDCLFQNGAANNAENLAAMNEALRWLEFYEHAPKYPTEFGDQCGRVILPGDVLLIPNKDADTVTVRRADSISMQRLNREAFVYDRCGMEIDLSRAYQNIEEAIVALD